MNRLVLGLLTSVIIGCGGQVAVEVKTTTQPSRPSKPHWHTTKYNDGFKAYNAGIDPKANPNIADHDYASAWLEGWMAAKAEASKK
jgi:hypothetical protein